eukprot:gene2730-5602_t
MVAGLDGSCGRELRVLTRLSSSCDVAPSPKETADHGQNDWDVLKEAMDAIHEHKSTKVPLQHLHFLAHRQTSRSSVDLFNKISETFKRHIHSRRHKLISTISSEVEDFLLNIANDWEDFLRYTRLTRSVFIHLDRLTTTTSSNIECLWDVSIRSFRQILYRDDVLSSKVSENFVIALTRLRNGQAISFSVLRSVSNMLTELGIYTVCLETSLLYNTAQFYQTDGDQSAASMKLAMYVNHIEKRLSDEITYCNQFLPAQTHASLRRVVEMKLIAMQKDFLLRNELFKLFEQEDLSSVGRLYKLILRVNLAMNFRDALNAYIKNEGEKIVNDKQHDNEMVNRLLLFKDRIQRIIESALCDKTLQASVRTQFSDFMSKRANKPAELIAIYLDSFLRKEIKGKTEEEIDQTLGRILGLFRFVVGKDMFMAFYQNCLARRLLHQKSASHDSEKLVVAKLKHECGPDFTAKFEGMLHDIDLSAQFNQEFKEVVDMPLCQVFLQTSQQTSGPDLYVNVLTASHWPTYEPSDVIVPPEIIRAQELFCKYYCSKHRNRKLTWQPSEGQCILGATFDKLNLSCPLVRVIFSDLFELKRTLQSLACGKTRVLAKNSQGKEVVEADKFMVNYKFSNERRRIKINQIQLKQTQQEADATAEKVYHDRNFAIDAAIVRIMKARKRLSNNDLFSELFQQLKFPVKHLDVKKRIEILLDREYLERDPEDQQCFKYLA